MKLKNKSAAQISTIKNGHQHTMTIVAATFSLMGGSTQELPMKTRAMPTSNFWLLFMALLMIGLVGCSSNKPVDIKDSGPAQPMDVSHIPDAVPRYEPRTRAGNKSPYTVLGKTYTLINDSRGFKEKGIASWYGNKFHGRRTSNGEIYSMYGMTAAHKTLPIPSYVRVTNLNNGRQIVVRVNDRGPFHSGRIIDLTYAGASKLGFIRQGTAPVMIETIEPGSPQPIPQITPAPKTESAAPMASTTLSTSTTISASTMPATVTALSASANAPKAPAPANSAGYQLPPNTYLQAGAFSSKTSADNLSRRIKVLTDFPVTILEPSADQLYRVHVGPLDSNLHLMQLRETLLQQNLPAPHVVYGK